MLHLIIINYEYNPASTNANEWLNHAKPLTNWAEELQAAGVQVTVFQRFLQDDVLKRAYQLFRMDCDNVYVHKKVEFGVSKLFWQKYKKVAPRLMCHLFVLR